MTFSLYNGSIRREKDMYYCIVSAQGKEQSYVYDEKRDQKTEARTSVSHAAKRGFLLSGTDGG